VYLRHLGSNPLEKKKKKERKNREKEKTYSTELLME
jgi:hypothetical protein